MPKYRLNKDLTFFFRSIHKVHAKKGTPVLSGSGGNYHVSPLEVETDSPRGSGTIWAHDTAQYYVWVPADAVEEVTE